MGTFGDEGRPQNAQKDGILKWTRMQGIGAIAGTIIAVGGAGFFLWDRFVSPGGATTSPAALSTPSVSVSLKRPTCASGSICLWSEPGFGGKSWMWSPGITPDGPLPDYLRDHVGSFDAQTTACFVDSETPEKRKVSLRDWSEKYLNSDRLGPRMDRIQARC